MRINLDYPLYIDEICKVINANVIGNINNDCIKSICTDTRMCMPGDLFIALKGDNDCGEKYIKDALKRNCHVIASSYEPSIIHTDNTCAALLNLARYYKSKTGIKRTVAVTGSVGKSTTVKFISKILNQRYKVHSPIGNFNNHIGVPLTVLGITKDTEILVAELGMNHTNEISALSKCVNPDIGIITSIGTSHIGNLGSRENIAKTKLEIMEGMKNGVVLLPFSEPLLSGIRGCLYVSESSPLSDFSLNKTENGQYSFSSIFGSIKDLGSFGLPKHLLINLAFAISVAKMLDLSDNEIISGIKTITNSDLRQRFIELTDFTIFDDSYNASIESIKADLEYLSTFNRPIGAFLGDILELGNNTDSIHKNVGRIAAHLNVDRLYLYGKNAEATACGAIEAGMKLDSIFVNTDLSTPEVSIAHIQNNHEPREIILFKASHKLRLDKIADMISQEERNNNDK